ncbi:PREDICTED: natural killer cells antigen CD94-like [Dipodomys ordii]|uniref:Natural killer cells antigen CD94-like n=1 Tax=Dipodomys ordii TaxID=10020 RepID=A0A1S3GSA3_DIPOR|nr:PREDICTED: natural killer cells antigen CD94-like [Dipodomys ordii]
MEEKTLRVTTSHEMPLTEKPRKHHQRHKTQRNTTEPDTDKGSAPPFPWKLVSGCLAVACLLLMAVTLTLAAVTAELSSEKTPAIQQKALLEDSCPEHWVWFRCCCYYLSKEMLTWRDSQRACSARSSSLLLMDGEEMKFFSLNSFFWIEGFYNTTGKQRLLKKENDQALCLNGPFSPEFEMQRQCQSYKSEEVYSCENCNKKKKYICKNDKGSRASGGSRL